MQERCLVLGENSRVSNTRFIPRKTRVKTEFARGITGGDLFYIALTFALVLGIGLSNLSTIIGRIIIAVSVFIVMVIGFLKTGEGVRVYANTWRFFKFIAYRKKYAKIPGGGWGNINDLIPYTGIDDDKYINFGKDYYGAVIEIHPLEFGLLDRMKQEALVNTFANAIRRINSRQNASIIRLEKGMILDHYIDAEIEKYEAMVKNADNGALSDDELASREIVFNERGILLSYMNDEEKIFKGSFYLVVYDSNKETLDNSIQGILSTLGGSSYSIECDHLTGKDLALFMRANYNKDFDERQLREMPTEKVMNWVVPNKVTFNAKSCKINGIQRAAFTITDYPLEVGTAWGFGIFNMPGTRTVLNFHMVPKLTAEKIIDKAIIEMKTQMKQSHKSSHKIERDAQLDTISNLLVQIKQNNEQMYDCTIHMTPDHEMRKEVKAKLSEEGFRYSELFGRQVDSFIGANVSRLETFPEYARGIPTTTIAAAFPFISDRLQDDKGICIGGNSNPVFVDFFKRNNVRVNSNMIVIGKSGSGKSFATKSVLAHLAADNTKIFICDPEREYTQMAKNFHGNSIDVGNAGKGRFNPFHIYPAMLDDNDETGQEYDDTFESHLRFLESYFKIVMEGIRPDALEMLNSLVAILYRLKGIDNRTDFKKVEPHQFPIFQELFDLTKKKFADAKDDFSRSNYRNLITYLEKFAEGGRYSGIWNGPATIKTNENFFVFDFLTLLANKNSTVANAQMLLVFKYLDGEIIKNREYNKRHNTKRKIVIVVDEAHVFIDEQRPIALDFMFNMAKRIRKYDGMQIIITQNIKDFVGSPIIAKKSAAIINASQYSMIFSLAPNDMTDLVTLYKNAGEINKTEQEQIVGNSRGQCFLITGPMNRTLVQIETSDAIRELFE